MLSSPYFRHALYSLACLSISINYVSLKRAVEEDKARIDAKISLLESIREHLRTKDAQDPKAEEELERLTRLYRRPQTTERGSLKDEITWTQIFSGMPASKLEKAGLENEMTRWEKEDLEKIKKEFNTES
ncbi:hypothetical protein CPB83DRAFT_910380 [Crepidotus variabilis]|uniref:Uncharacterized protein n=1 Tax=Crepidotus variabilis TaxID=179855 RepID=A0A9P6E7F8_9AGAR|nr:hypothetical protein CPB83DRAFT_910380 [Crepidotus variabilis]